MPLTESQVLEALAPVNEPMLRRPIADLGLVKRVRVDGNRVEVLVSVLEQTEPGIDDLMADVREAVSALDGVAQVDVPVVVLEDDERTALAARLRSERGIRFQTSPSIVGQVG